MTDYEMLGLLPGATRAEVRARFVELARVHHPDRGGDAAAFAELVAARDRLLARAPERARCVRCDGDGTVLVRRGFAQTRVACPACGGTGAERDGP